MQKDHIVGVKRLLEDTLVYIVQEKKSYIYLFQLSCKT